jgi:hypothetical protein
VLACNLRLDYYRADKILAIETMVGTAGRGETPM